MKSSKRNRPANQDAERAAQWYQRLDLPESQARDIVSASPWGAALALAQASPGSEDLSHNSPDHERQTPRPSPELAASLEPALTALFQRASAATDANALSHYDLTSRFGGAKERRALGLLIESASDWGLFDRALALSGALLTQSPDFFVSRFALLPAFLRACSRGSDPTGALCAQRLYSLANARAFWSAQLEGQKQLTDPASAAAFAQSQQNDRSSLSESMGAALVLAFKNPQTQAGLRALTHQIFKADADSPSPVRWQNLAIPLSLSALTPPEGREDVVNSLPPIYWINALSALRALGPHADPLAHWVAERCLEIAALDHEQKISDQPWYAMALAYQLALLCDRDSLCALERKAPGALEKASELWEQTRLNFDFPHSLYALETASLSSGGAWAHSALKAARAAYPNDARPRHILSDLISAKTVFGMSVLIQRDLLSESLSRQPLASAAPARAPKGL